MACVYFYKGYLFDSELLLDDFLLEVKPYEPELGDIVFQITTSQAHALSTINKIARDNADVNRRYKEYRNSEKARYDEFGEVDGDMPPYVGVNKYLSKFVDEYGRRLFPEFIKEEYWSRRYEDWRQGIYNDTEIEVFGFDKTKPLPHVTDEDELQKKSDMMENKWKILGYIGNAVHNVLLLCFTYKDGSIMLDKSESELRDYIDKNLERKNKAYVMGDMLEKAIAHARQVKAELENKLEGPLMFFPEFGVSAKTNIVDNKSTELLGIIDLLVIDKYGRAHILDYKTSIHKYSDFSDTKELTYKYLMATYLRMLEKYGINCSGGQLMVAPILILGFRKEGDSYIYDTIGTNITFESLNSKMNIDRMWENLDSFLPLPDTPNIKPSNTSLNVSEIMAKWFPNYRSVKLITEELVIRELKKTDKLKRNAQNKFVYKTVKGKPDIEETDEATFIKKVVEFRKSEAPKRDRYTQLIKDALKDTVKNGMNPSIYPSKVGKQDDVDSSATWLTDTLGKYGDGNWKVVDNNVLETFGIITLQTVAQQGQTPLVDFVRISTNTLTSDYRETGAASNRRSLLSAFVSDIVENSKSNSLMLPAVQGNVELMEMMLIVNLLDGMQNSVIGNMSVVNVHLNTGLTAYNEELLYCFNQLNKYAAVAHDKFKAGEIKFASRFEIARLDFLHVMATAERNKYRRDDASLIKLKDCTSLLDDTIDGTTEDKIRALSELLYKLEKDNTRLSLIYKDPSDLNNRYVKLHNDILLALAQLKGINFRLQLSDHDSILSAANPLIHGLAGTSIDNPGNQLSETLNIIAKLTTEAYQLTRDEMLRSRDKILKLTENLKRAKGYGKLELTYKNQVGLFSNMIEFTENDMLFVKPETLALKEEREFLSYVLEVINRDRFPDKGPQELAEMARTGDTAYYQVPIARGGGDSFVHVRGLLAGLRNKLHYLMNPKEAVLMARDKLEGIFNADEEARARNSRLIFKMTNLFDSGLDPLKRAEYFKKHGFDNVERNLESLLYKHIFAYSVLRNINAIFPLIRAAMIHLSTAGASQNTKFNKDLNYAADYVKNKILNLSIIEEKWQSIAKVMSDMRLFTSVAALAFSPVLLLYLPLQGLWLDISLIIRKPDGTNAFTKAHFGKALKMAYSDLAHFSENPTLCLLFNETYGLNDMDMNQFAERLSTSKRGLWNFLNFAFKFASRPDYYNRLTIWLALLMGDKSLDAHKVVDGKLVYDWKLDGRFSKFAADPTSKSTDPEFLKLKALYYAMALEFVREGARMPNGDLFEFKPDAPMALPRAYTNREAESMKSLADNIYGYYAHEKKSLMMSSFLGSMWLLFKTYWSAKKNQYLLPGGVYLQGKWEHYSENKLDENGQPIVGEDGLYVKVKYYQKLNDDGTIDYESGPIPEDSPEFNPNKVIPFMLWKGRWQEGIILTLSDLVRQCYDKGSFVGGILAKWNDPDPMMRMVYRSNIKLAGYDLFMFLVIGVLLGGALDKWLEEQDRERKKRLDASLGTAVGLDLGKIVAKAVHNSAADLNAVTSIGGAMYSWTPTAFEFGGRLMQNMWNVATGDRDFWDGIMRTNALTNSFRNTLDTIKPEAFNYTEN